MTRFLISILVLMICTGCSGKAKSRQNDDEQELRDKAANMLIVGFRGFDKESSRDAIRYVKDLHVGGVIYFDRDLTTGEKGSPRNIKSPEQLKRLSSELKSAAGNRKIFISIDQEGGMVNRLKPEYGFPASVSAQQLGQKNDREYTYSESLKTAETLKAAGINLNFAPSVDVNVNPDCPVIGKMKRSFSDNPETVWKNASWFIDGHHKCSILTAIKHFPGHGSANADSHLGFTDVTGTWSEKELIPFRKLIGEKKADIIMTAHIFNANIDSVYPATLSEKTINGILRKQLGYDGVVITDDMYMNAISRHYTVREAVIRAINAGADMMILGNNSPSGYFPNRPDEVIDLIADAVKSGEISMERIDEANKRIETLKNRLE